jgi:hypothetical protein
MLIESLRIVIFGVNQHGAGSDRICRVSRAAQGILDAMQVRSFSLA